MSDGYEVVKKVTVSKKPHRCNVPSDRKTRRLDLAQGSVIRCLTCGRKRRLTHGTWGVLYWAVMFGEQEGIG